MESALLKVTHALKKRLELTFTHLNAEDSYTVSLEENSNDVWKVTYNADGELKHLVGKVSKINLYNQSGPQKEISPGIVDLVLRVRSGCRITFDTSTDFEAGSETIDVSNIRAVTESKYIPCPNPDLDVRKPIIVPVDGFAFIKSIYPNDYSTFEEIPNKLLTDKTVNAQAMFSECCNLKKIESINTRNMTNMNAMFYNCWSLEEIPMMDTSRVTTMAGIFAYCYKLVTIPALDTRSVRTFSDAFKCCTTLINLPEINMSSTVSTENMFEGCTSLEEVSFTKGSLRVGMDFSDCRLSKHCVLNIIKNLGTPLGDKPRTLVFKAMNPNEVHTAGDYLYTYDIDSYNKFIKPAIEAGWIIEGITWEEPATPALRTDFSRYMSNTYPLTYRDMTFVELPDTSAATTMQDMFAGCISLLNVPKTLATDKVLNMSGMFSNCIRIVTIPYLNTAKVVNMTSAFYGCNNLVAVPKLLTSKVTSFKNTFSNCLKLNTIAELDFSSVVDAEDMFNRCPNLEQMTIKRGTLHCSLDVSNTKLNKTSIFSILDATGEINFGNELNFIGVPEADNLTAEEYKIHVKPVLDSGWVIKGIKEPKTLSIINFSYYMKNNYPETYMSMMQPPEIPDTSEAVYVTGMYEGCEQLLSAAQMHLPKITNADHMFYGCTAILSISDMRETKELASVDSMFYACSRLLTSPAINTSNVSNFRDMFNSCQLLRVVSELDMSSAVSTDNMFKGCTSLQTLNIKPDTLHITLDLSDTNLTKENLLNIILNAGDPIDEEQSIIFKNVRCQNDFTEEDILTYIKPAIEKGWNIDCDIEIPLKRTDFSWYMKKTFPDVYQILSVAPEVDTSAAKYTDHMYEGCVELTRIPNELDMSEVIHAFGMFKDCTKLTEIHIKEGTLHCTLNLSYTAIEKDNVLEIFKAAGDPVDPTAALIFTNGVYNLTKEEYEEYVVSVIQKGWKVSGIYEPTELETNFSEWIKKQYPSTYATLEAIPKLPNTSAGTDMSYMFAGAAALKMIPGEFDTGVCTNMAHMYENCTSLVITPVMDTTACTDMTAMFYNCNNLAYIQSDINFNGITEDTSLDMFKGCFKLQLMTITPNSLTCSLDLSDTMLDQSCIVDILSNLPKLTDGIEKTIKFPAQVFTQEMFTSYVEAAINKGWTIVGITESSEPQPISDFTNYMKLTYPDTFLTIQTCPEIDTTYAVIMQSMFAGCLELRNVVKLNTANVYNMNSMFAGCLHLEAIPELDMSNVSDATLMLANCGNLVDFAIKPGSLNTNLDMSDCLKLSNESIFNILDNLKPIEATLTLNFATKILSMEDYNAHVAPAIAKGWRIIGLTRQLRTNFNDYMSIFYPETYQTLSVVNNLEPTTEALTMNSMFKGCVKLAVAPAMQTSKVYDMTEMFDGCTNLVSVQGLSMLSAQHTRRMFAGCVNLKLVSFTAGSLKTTVDFSDCPLTRQVVLSIIKNASSEPEVGATLVFANTEVRAIEWEQYVVPAQNNGWSITGLSIYATDPGDDPEDPVAVIYAADIITDPDHQFMSQAEKEAISENNTETDERLTAAEAKLEEHTTEIQTNTETIASNKSEFDEYVKEHTEEYEEHKDIEDKEAEEQAQIMETLSWGTVPSADAAIPTERTALREFKLTDNFIKAPILIPPGVNVLLLSVDGSLSKGASANMKFSSNNMEWLTIEVSDQETFADSVYVGVTPGTYYYITYQSTQTDDIGGTGGIYYSEAINNHVYTVTDQQ